MTPVMAPNLSSVAPPGSRVSYGRHHWTGSGDLTMVALPRGNGSTVARRVLAKVVSTGELGKAICICTAIMATKSDAVDEAGGTFVARAVVEGGIGQRLTLFSQGVVDIGAPELDPVRVSVEILKSMESSAERFAGGFSISSLDGSNGILLKLNQSSLASIEIFAVEMKSRSGLIVVDRHISFGNSGAGFDHIVVGDGVDVPVFGSQLVVCFSGLSLMGNAPGTEGFLSEVRGEESVSFRSEQHQAHGNGKGTIAGIGPPVAQLRPH